MEKEQQLSGGKGKEEKLEKNCNEMRRERRREEGVGGRGGKERLKLSLRKKKNCKAAEK